MWQWQILALATDLLMGQLRAEYPTGRYNNGIRSPTGPNGQKNRSNNNNSEGSQTNTNKEANDGAKSPKMRKIYSTYPSCKWMYIISCVDWPTTGLTNAPNVIPSQRRNGRSPR